MKNNFYQISMCFIIIAGFFACSFQNPGVTATPPSGGPTPAPPIIPGLELLYHCASTEPEYNQIIPHFNIVNNGTLNLDLTQIVIQYYFTKEGHDIYYFFCDYAEIDEKYIAHKFADGYVEIGFRQGTGTLSVGQETGEIQVRFAKRNWSNWWILS